jgi:hypothetical protein
LPKVCLEQLYDRESPARNVASRSSTTCTKKLLEVISERSETLDVANVPAAKTGLVVKTLKGLGAGDNFKVIEEYEVDCPTVREMRALREQVAEEVG